MYKYCVCIFKYPQIITVDVFYFVWTGLCGDYNGKAEDDLQKPDRSPAKGPTDFGNSFKVIQGSFVDVEAQQDKTNVL